VSKGPSPSAVENPLTCPASLKTAISVAEGIKAALGLDLADPDIRFALQFACRARLLTAGDVRSGPRAPDDHAAGNALQSDIRLAVHDGPRQEFRCSGDPLDGV